jgi:hypothetical protein
MQNPLVRKRKTALTLTGLLMEGLGTERSRAVENRTSCGIILPNRNVDAASEVAMKSRVWQKRVALLLLILYSIDLSWKLANWRETFSGVAWWGT